MASGATASAQEIYRASWTIQDKGRGLKQELAQSVIERANDWLTRDDPNESTARIDDPLRVTVVGEMMPSGGLVHPRLRRLVLGTIVIDTSFGDFLDTATIASLVRRDHYWRDESVVVYDPSVSPIMAIGNAEDDTTALLFQRTFGGERVPRIRLGLDESRYSISSDAYAWAGLGYEELGLPDFSYGRIRIGAAYGMLKIWGEVPAALGSLDNVVLARGLEGAYGFGLSFEQEWLGGAVSIADISEQIGTPATAEQERYYMATSAFAYGIVPIRLLLLDNMPIRAKLGIGYHQAQQVPVAEDGGTHRTVAEGLSGLKVMARIEIATLDREGSTQRRCAAELFGGSLIASYQEQILPVLGVRAAVAAHGVFGTRDPYLPPYSISITPIISIW